MSVIGPIPYAVVTPARNEEENISRTIDSMVAQTARPLIWVIVDDGSTDRTAEIIDTASKAHPWILSVHRKDRGFRKQGGGVVETFNEGFVRIGQIPWNFLVKLDADLSFADDYFARCLARFVAEPRLGIGGGVISQKTGSAFEPESPDDPLFHVRGATKIYRRACWDQIGGLVVAPGWDTIDELMANTLGWTTATFVEIPLWHHRPCGSADGTWRNLVKFGVANYISGYHPLFMLAKCVRRSVQRPIVVGSVALAWGFLKAPFTTTVRVRDPRYHAFVRKQQIAALLNRRSLWNQRASRAI